MNFKMASRLLLEDHLHFETRCVCVEQRASTVYKLFISNLTLAIVSLNFNGFRPPRSGVASSYASKCVF